MNRQSFLHGAFVLVAAALVTRVLGFVYRVFLTRLIGAQGMGLFQIVFPLLSLVLTFVTAGLPVAISKLVAEALVQGDRVRIRRILRVSSGVILSMAVLFTALMWLLRGFVRAHWLSDPRAYPAYLCMIPVVGVIAVSSIYRGYFQGLQLMSPPAWASILETVVRIGSIWVMATYLIHVSLAYAAAAAMAGMVLGELAGLLWLMFRQRRVATLAMVLPDAPARSLETTGQTLKAVADIAVPVTFSRLIGSLIWAIEPTLVARSLASAGITTHTATALYGQYSGMAIPLLVFPTVFTGSLAVNLVPSVSEAAAGSELRRIRLRMAQSWQASALIGFPSAALLTLFAEPLCRIVFREPSVGPILAAMAPIGFLLYLQGPLAGILQGLNKAGVAMANSVIGGIVRLGLIYALASRPHLNIVGVAYATTIAVGLTTVLHLWAIARIIGFSVRITDTAKIAVASLCMLCLMDAMTKPAWPLNGMTLSAVTFCGFATYFVLLCSFRVLTSGTMRRIPRVGRLLGELVAHIPFAV